MILTPILENDYGKVQNFNGRTIAVIEPEFSILSLKRLSKKRSGIASVANFLGQETR